MEAFFWKFLGFIFEDFFGGIFFGGIFGRNFLGGYFWEDFIFYNINLKVSYTLNINGKTFTLVSSISTSGSCPAAMSESVFNLMTIFSNATRL